MAAIVCIQIRDNRTDCSNYQRSCQLHATVLPTFFSQGKLHM